MHDCANCGCACYCHGDIDDSAVEDPAYAYVNCTGCGCSEDEDDLYDLDWLPENEPEESNATTPNTGIISAS